MNPANPRSAMSSNLQASAQGAPMGGLPAPDQAQQYMNMQAQAGQARAPVGGPPQGMPPQAQGMPMGGLPAPGQGQAQQYLSQQAQMGGPPQGMPPQAQGMPMGGPPQGMPPQTPQGSGSRGNMQTQMLLAQLMRGGNAPVYSENQ